MGKGKIKSDLINKPWWSFIDEDLQELLLESGLLASKVELWDEKFDDYSFVVFPSAKAYEGFLKNLFLDKGFIDEADYYGKRFRVGKALNPALERRYREKEGVYDKIVEFCGGKDVADSLWKTWKRCRNLLFHWFPNEKNAVNFEEAKDRVNMVIDTIDLAFRECRIGEDTG